MNLRDLVDHPGLGLTLLHGTDALDRTIGAVFTTDLLDPRRYLPPDPLVLTGLMWRRGPADSDTFVRSLADAGVVALGAGEAAFGSVPEDVVDACRRHGVALVRVPVDVSFGQISDVVAAAHENARGQLLAASLGRQRRLLSAVAEGRSPAELLTLVRDDVGVTCRVLTPTGRHVAAATGPLPGADVDAATHAYLTTDRMPGCVELSDGSVATVLTIDSRLEHRLASWFLLCDGDHREWTDDTMGAVRELATVIALERQRWDGDRTATRRIADEVLSLVATGRAASAELKVRLADLGADPDGRCLVATATRPGSIGLVDATHAVLHDAALQASASPVTGVLEGRPVAILTAASPDDRGVLRAAFARLAPGIGRDRLAVGMSAAVGPEALAGALAEAVHAVRLAELRGEPVSTVTSDDVTSHVLLLGAVPDEVRHAFADRVLGRVLDHDARHGGDLLATLTAFLAADGSWQRCAQDLHVHVNTVRYRLRKIEELTGRDLRRLDDRVDVFLALRSRPRPE